MFSLPESVMKLLGTNYVPSEDESRQIKDCLTVLQEENSGGWSRPVAAQVVRELKALLSHARRLPPEIVAMIFAFCLPLDALPRATPLDAPLLLGHICSTWRQILHSTPRLWTSLAVHLPVTTVYWDELVEEVLAVMHTWLERSQPFPMTIAFIDHGRFPPNCLTAIVDTLTSHSHRWRHMSFYVSSRCYSSLFKFSHAMLSSLESLTIHDNLENIRGQHSPVLYLPSAPRLRYLSFTTQWFSSEHIIADWDRLTELSLLYEPNHYRMPLHNGFLKVLDRCHNITTCSLGIGIPVGDDALEPDRIITLHHLHTLRIRRLWPESITGGFLDALVLPQLKALEIDGSALFVWTATPWHDGQFPLLLSRSGCQLERLSVKGVHFSEDDLLDCLTHTPSLKHLAYSPCPRWESVFEILYALTPMHLDSQSAPGLKNLESLQLESGIGAASSLDIFVRMLASRWSSRSHEAGIARLCRLDLPFIAVPVGIPPSHEDVETFKKRLQDCAGGDPRLVVTVTVERPYQPVYLQLPGSTNNLHPNPVGGYASWLSV
ncbi:hypothetical protein BV22DRAFT_1041125 [Leucogyrophana mollusca]|uniref:Uncharacterized protein n=1 Tax=Leucogyrophana mollusca TaxID=85980 RepID=A0ACB8B137_9AGAM|nr:hypothetical protein BV22DRAFT_1041125 [Leucogyrophana mollusca]